MDPYDLEKARREYEQRKQAEQDAKAAHFRQTPFRDYFYQLKKDLETDPAVNAALLEQVRRGGDGQHTIARIRNDNSERLPYCEQYFLPGSRRQWPPCFMEAFDEARVRRDVLLLEQQGPVELAGGIFAGRKLAVKHVHSPKFVDPPHISILE
jgi:hypothetical protein